MREASAHPGRTRRAAPRRQAGDSPRRAAACALRTWTLQSGAAPGGATNGARTERRHALALLGSVALGFAVGWLCFLVGRGTRRMLGISARAFAFAGVALVGAAALGFFHVGPNGALM